MSKQAVEVGQRWSDKHGTVKIMAVVGGYVMARRPYAMPFVVPIKEFVREWACESRQDVEAEPTAGGNN